MRLDASLKGRSIPIGDEGQRMVSSNRLSLGATKEAMSPAGDVMGEEDLGVGGRLPLLLMLSSRLVEVV